MVFYVWFFPCGGSCIFHESFIEIQNLQSAQAARNISQIMSWNSKAINVKTVLDALLSVPQKKDTLFWRQLRKEEKEVIMFSVLHIFGKKKKTWRIFYSIVHISYYYSSLTKPPHILPPLTILMTTQEFRFSFHLQDVLLQDIFIALFFSTEIV